MAFPHIRCVNKSVSDQQILLERVIAWAVPVPPFATSLIEAQKGARNAERDWSFLSFLLDSFLR